MWYIYITVYGVKPQSFNLKTFNLLFRFSLSRTKCGWVKQKTDFCHPDTMGSTYISKEHSIPLGAYDRKYRIYYLQAFVYINISYLIFFFCCTSRAAKNWVTLVRWPQSLSLFLTLSGIKVSMSKVSGLKLSGQTLNQLEVQTQSLFFCLIRLG